MDVHKCSGEEVKGVRGISFTIKILVFRTPLGGCVKALPYLITAASGIKVQRCSWRLMALTKSFSVRRLCRQEFM